VGWPSTTPSLRCFRRTVSTYKIKKYLFQGLEFVLNQVLEVVDALEFLEVQEQGDVAQDQVVVVGLCGDQAGFQLLLEGQVDL